MAGLPPIILSIDIWHWWYSFTPRHCVLQFNIHVVPQITHIIYNYLAFIVVNNTSPIQRSVPPSLPRATRSTTALSDCRPWVFIARKLAKTKAVPRRMWSGDFSWLLAYPVSWHVGVDIWSNSLQLMAKMAFAAEFSFCGQIDGLLMAKISNF